MSSKKRWKYEVRKAAAFITTDDGGTPPGDGGTPPDSGAGGGDGGTPPTDDLASLFTPEEITAQRERLAATRAEEERRAALTDEQRAAEDAARAEEAAKNGVPEKYEFAAPEGMTLNEEMTGKFSEIAKGLGLNQENAQSLVNLGGELVQQVYSQIQEAWDTKREGWAAAALADKEIGADVAKGKDSAAARAFATIATPEMKAIFEETAIGDHPEVLRMFYRLSQRMKEDDFESGGAGMGLKGKGAASVMYPTMAEQ